MGSFKHHRVFQPHELEIIDRVFEAAWARLNARHPFREAERDKGRQEALRKIIMDQTGTDRVQYSALGEKVLSNLDQMWSRSLSEN
jgi:hypothetical protein